MALGGVGALDGSARVALTAQARNDDERCDRPHHEAATSDSAVPRRTELPGEIRACADANKVWATQAMPHGPKLAPIHTICAMPPLRLPGFNWRVLKRTSIE